MRLKYKSMTQSEISVAKVMDSYRMLSSEDIEAKNDANQFLFLLSRRDEVWYISKALISDQDDQNFKFLGSQYLYQKVAEELHSISSQRKIQIRSFLFQHLQNSNITLSATLDRLACSCALLGCSMYLAEWPTFMQDIFEFMKQSQHCLLSGLYILEAIPEQLRKTNKIPMGLRNTIMDEMLKYQAQMIEVFETVLGFQGENRIKSRCLKAMSSWAESRFNFLNHPETVKKVLLLSTEDIEKLEHGLNLIFQTIRSVSSNKTESLSHEDPLQELTYYSAQEIESIRLIVEYIMAKKEQFLGSNLEAEEIQKFSSVVKQSLQYFGFLICEEIGFKLLEFVVKLTHSSDLKTSRNTFDFWVDFSEKMANSKISMQIKNHFATYLLQIFKTVNVKNTVPHHLLDDAELREDMTIDDINNITFSEYRKDSVLVYQFVFEFFMKVTGNSNFYFEECFKYIKEDLSKNSFGSGTELALFCIKSAAESLVSAEDAANLRNVIGFVMEKGDLAPPRVISEILSLIRDCTREIKDDHNFTFTCLQYSMKYLSDEQLLFPASDAFKCLLETFTQVNDPSFVNTLINFYGQSGALKDIIIDKVVDGIVSIIFKINSLEGIQCYIQKFSSVVMSRFEESHNRVQQDPNVDKPYFLALLEIKSILENFDGAGAEIKKHLIQYFYEMSKKALQMIEIVIPFCLKNEYKYILMNELGLSCSIFKYVIRICNERIDPLFLQVISNSLTVLTPVKIVEMGALLNLLNESLLVLMGKNMPVLNEWLLQKMPHFNQFFLQYFQFSPLPDPDAVRRCYEVQESLIIYNPDLFLAISTSSNLFNGALYYLRHINEQKMQRKLINFLYLCLQIDNILHPNKQRVLETIVGSIPILHSHSTANFSKIFRKVLASIPAESHRPLLRSLMVKSPYQEISKTTLEILIESLLFAHNTNKDRWIMMIVKDLTDLVVQGQNSQSAMHLEFRLSTWKKETKKGE